MSLAPAPAQLRMMPDPMLPHPAVIEDIQPEAYGISTFSLVFTDPAQASTYRFQAWAIQHDLPARVRRSCHLD